MRHWPRLIRAESGVALVTALLLLVSLTAIGVYATNVAVVHEDISANLKATKQAFFLADAGIEHAKQFLKQSLATCGTCWDNYATFQTLVPTTQLSANNTVVGTYTVTIVAAGGPGGVSRRVVSTGTISTKGNTASQGQAVVEALFGNNPNFPCDVCSKGDLTLSGGSMTDSFDSSQTGYRDYATAPHTNNGDVAANGNITLNGTGTKVNGNATEGGTAAIDASQVSGTITTGGPQQYFPPVAPCGPPYSSGAGITLGGATYDQPSGQLKGAGNVTVTLAAGTYCFSSIQLTGNGSSLKVDTTTGGVQVYLTADSTLGGNSITNTSGVASNFMIYSSVSSSNQGITLTGGSNAYATVYAPNAHVKLSGGSDYYGSIVSGSFDEQGGTNFHYDRALKNLPNGGLALVTWRQVF